MEDTFNDVRHMSELDFRKHLLDWMQSTDVSRRIQAKLRREMIDCFSATALGREIEMRQKQFGKPLVPTASILALNTLVAEFLFTQNCQFTLSVFASEVPYQGIIPDFESGPIDRVFRFSATEQENLLHSLEAPRLASDQIRQNYDNLSPKESTNISLLYQVVRTVFSTEIHKKSEATANMSTQCNLKQQHQKCRLFSKSTSKYLVSLRSHIDKFAKIILNINDTLCDRIFDDASLEAIDNLMPELRKRRQRIGVLSTRVENDKLKQVVKSIYQLSTELERCVNRFKSVVNRKQQEDVLIKRCNAKVQTNNDEEHVTAATEDEIGYADWVRDLKESTNGKRFLHHLVEHYRRVKQKDADAQAAAMAEEIKFERSRLKLHYKQRFIDRCQGLMMITTDHAAPGEDSQQQQQQQLHSDQNIKTINNHSEKIVPLDEIPRHNRHKFVGLLSNRKLPDIEISPEVNQPFESPVTNKTSDANKQFALKTRQRMQQLVAESDDIEQLIETRLNQHTINAQTIVEQQRVIKQQSNLGHQLISSAARSTKQRIHFVPECTAERRFEQPPVTDDREEDISRIESDGS